MTDSKRKGREGTTPKEPHAERRSKETQGERNQNRVRPTPPRTLTDTRSSHPGGSGRKVPLRQPYHSRTTPHPFVAQVKLTVKERAGPY
jgi:hypothetical protein